MYEQNVFTDLLHVIEVCEMEMQAAIFAFLICISNLTHEVMNLSLRQLDVTVQINTCKITGTGTADIHNETDSIVYCGGRSLIVLSRSGVRYSTSSYLPMSSHLKSVCWVKAVCSFFQLYFSVFSIS